MTNSFAYGQEMSSQANVLKENNLTSTCLASNYPYKQRLQQANATTSKFLASKCLQANVYKQSRQANVKQANIMSPAEAVCVWHSHKLKWQTLAVLAGLKKACL